MCRRYVVPVLALLAAPVVVRAQTAPHTLAGHHQVTLIAGLNIAARTAATVGATGVTVTNNSTGVLGGIGYAYWYDEQLSLFARVVAMGVSADYAVTGWGTLAQSGRVGSLQLGWRYQFARLAPSNALRPHSSLSIGPLFSSAETVTAGFPVSVTVVEQAVASGELSLGAELSLGRYFTIGADAGYFLAADFDQWVGARDNYSSPVLTLSLGVLIGRGRSAYLP